MKIFRLNQIFIVAGLPCISAELLAIHRLGKPANPLTGIWSLMAQSGPSAESELCPFLGETRTSNDD